MSETRAAVRAHVESNPGVHFNAVTREVGIATGQTQYHLRRLLRDGAVTRRDVCGRTHYFPDGYTEREQAAIALFRRETTRDIVLELLERGEYPVAELTTAVDVARSTVEWHLSNLVEYDLAEKRKDGRAVTVRLTDPETTRRLLVEVDPSLADRLVDRFTRFVDSVFEA